MAIKKPAWCWLRWIIASREQSQSSAGVSVSFGLRFDGTLTNP